MLMKRDLNRWYISFDDAMIKIMWGKWDHRLASLNSWFVRPLRDVHLRWAKDWMRAHSADEMRRIARDQYRQHYARVRRIVPPNRLLEYKLESEWKPLCEFLSKNVPDDVKFPRVNETTFMHEKISIILRRGLCNLLRRALLWIVEPLTIAAIRLLLMQREGFLHPRQRRQFLPAVDRWSHLEVHAWIIYA